MNEDAKLICHLLQFQEFISTESVTKHDLYEMQKESLKRGNNKCHTQNNRKLGRVDFIVSIQ